MNYIAQHVGYAEPQPIEPQDEMANLQREFIQSNKEQAARTDRIEKLFARSQPKKRS